MEWNLTEDKSDKGAVVIGWIKLSGGWAARSGLINKDRTFWMNSNEHMRSIQCTHWMPLPSDPNSDAEGKRSKVMPKNDMTDKYAVAVKELELSMQCNCDLDRWQPEKDTGHSWVCRIHKAAKGGYKSVLDSDAEGKKELK